MLLYSLMLNYIICWVSPNLPNYFLDNPSQVGEGAVVFENVSSKTTNAGEVQFLSGKT